MTPIRIPVALLSLLLAFSACAAKPAPRYVRAQVVKEDPPKPAIVEVAKPVPIPGQLKRLGPPDWSAVHQLTPAPNTWGGR